MIKRQQSSLNNHILFQKSRIKLLTQTRHVVEGVEIPNVSNMEQKLEHGLATGRDKLPKCTDKLVGLSLFSTGIQLVRPAATT